MEIRPEDSTSYLISEIEHVVMVIPVDRNDDKAQNVGEEYWQERTERVETDDMRNAQLEHHDRNQDRDHAVAERTESVTVHWFDFLQAGAAGRDSRIYH